MNDPLSKKGSPLDREPGALRIALIYLVTGGLWIVFSDQVASAMVHDQALLTTISTIKGWGYVLVTAALLYWLVRRELAALRSSEERVQKLNADLEQRVHQRTAELSDLYNNAPCGYHSLDGAGVIQRINDTELAWLGYTRPELEGKLRAYDLLTPESQRVYTENFPLFKERGWLRDLELQFVRKDGSILPVLISATAIRDPEGNFQSSRTTLIDFSALKQAEEALQQSNRKLEAVNQELEAFAFSVSHDLRAPLRAIDGYSDIILQDYASRLDAEGKQLLETIHASVTTMDRLITDLLALSRVGRTELTYRRLDMAALARSVYRDIAPPDVLASFTFTVGSLPPAYGDPTLIRQVWNNLISNAIKYTLPSPAHQIEIRGNIEGGRCVYSIRDSGVGFDPEFAGKMFGVFQRLHHGQEFEGSGVGLAIVQRIVRRHGGEAWAQGALNQGATFYFSLPSRSDVTE